LRWWDESGNLLLTGDERAIAEKQARLDAEAIANQQTAIAEQARLIATQERLAKQEAEQKAQRLAEKLRSLGINPDDV
jgi:non-ribosomal peptide synthetase component E (peptide arylation enzyme)